MASKVRASLGRLAYLECSSHVFCCSIKKHEAWVMMPWIQVQSSPGVLVLPSFWDTTMRNSIRSLYVLAPLQRSPKYQSALKAHSKRPLLCTHIHIQHMAHTITESPMKADWNFHAPGSAVVLDTARHKWLLQKCQKKIPKNPWNDWTNGKSKTIENRFSIVKQNWGIFGSWAHHEKGLKRLSKALAPQASKRSHNCAVPIVFSSGSTGCWDVPYIYCMHGEYNESCIFFRVPVCSSSTSSISQNCYPALQILCLFRLWTERSLRLCSQTRRPRSGMLYNFICFTVRLRFAMRLRLKLWVVGMGLVALSRSQRISRFCQLTQTGQHPRKPEHTPWPVLANAILWTNLVTAHQKDIKGTSSSGLILHDVLL